MSASDPHAAHRTLVRPIRRLAAALTLLCASLAVHAALGDAQPTPPGADSLATVRDSMVRTVLASIAGRESMPAESVFKDIRVLKGMPAGRLVRVMDMGLSRSLGVGCDHCHVVGEWAKEDRAKKQVARAMWTMTQKLNQETLPAIPGLEGKPPVVNCTTCHRGSRIPATRL